MHLRACVRRLFVWDTLVIHRKNMLIRTRMTLDASVVNVTSLGIYGSKIEYEKLILLYIFNKTNYLGYFLNLFML